MLKTGASFRSDLISFSTVVTASGAALVSMVWNGSVSDCGTEEPSIDALSSDRNLVTSHFAQPTGTASYYWISIVVGWPAEPTSVRNNPTRSAATRTDGGAVSFWTIYRRSSWTAGRTRGQGASPTRSRIWTAGSSRFALDQDVIILAVNRESQMQVARYWFRVDSGAADGPLIYISNSCTGIRDLLVHALRRCLNVRELIVSD